MYKRGQEKCSTRVGKKAKPDNEECADAEEVIEQTDGAETALSKLSGKFVCDVL